MCWRNGKVLSWSVKLRVCNGFDSAVMSAPLSGPLSCCHFQQHTLRNTAEARGRLLVCRCTAALLPLCSDGSELDPDAPLHPQQRFQRHHPLAHSPLSLLVPVLIHPAFPTSCSTRLLLAIRALRARGCLSGQKQQQKHTEAMGVDLGTMAEILMSCPARHMLCAAHESHEPHTIRGGCVCI